MPARTGAASLTGASGRVDVGEAVSLGIWAAVAGGLPTNAVAGIASGPSGIGTNAGAAERDGAASCSSGVPVAADVSGACEPVLTRAASGAARAATGERLVVTTVGATGAAAKGV